MTEQPASLRDRIRRAICEASGFEWDDDTLELDEYGEHADAVLAVLPAGSDRAAVLHTAADALSMNWGGPDHEDGMTVARQQLRRMADEAEQQADLETTARVLAGLHRSAAEDVNRVIALYERWVKAGPPPLGTSVARWWDKRLVELHDAIRPPADGGEGGAS